MNGTQPPDTVLYAIERHCNNFFNPRNDPSDPTRDYPASFTELAGRIAQFITDAPTGSITSFTNMNYSESHDLEYTSWQKAFARELSIYKRAKFI